MDVLGGKIVAGPISSVVLFLCVFSAWSGLVWLVGWSPGVLPAAARLATLAAFLSLLPLALVAMFQPLSFRNQPFLPSHLNASAIPCGDFSSHFKIFESKGNQGKTKKQQKSNEIAAFSLLFCCFCVLA